MSELSHHLKKVASKYSLLDGTRFSILERGIDETLSLGGEIWECGAFKGGTALYMKAHLLYKNSNKTVRLFDTFSGMPTCTEHDIHKVGSFSDADLKNAEAITAGLENIHIHVGTMPESFKGLESCQIDIAHIDVDNYLSVKDCLEFIYPRMPIGGFIVIDDYNDFSCLGAKKATDDFLNIQYDLFNKKQEINTPNNPQNPQVFIVKR